MCFWVQLKAVLGLGPTQKPPLATLYNTVSSDSWDLMSTFVNDLHFIYLKAPRQEGWWCAALSSHPTRAPSPERLYGLPCAALTAGRPNLMQNTESSSGATQPCKATFVLLAETGEPSLACSPIM